MAHPNKRMALVADVGGTNSRVALADGPRIKSATIRRYRNAEFLEFASVSGQRMTIDASLIEADANKQNSTLKDDWDSASIDCQR